MIAIIDYGMGNLRSVQKALERVGAEALLTEDPACIAHSPAIVLPGVGAFGDAIETLRHTGLDEAIREAIEEGRPFLGICLGMQLLFEESEEMGQHKGLGVFGGRVVRFDTALKVPHIGWNQIHIRRETPLLAGIAEGSYAYFVHSYYVQPAEPEIVLATTDYGVDYASIVGRDNIFGIQFHPEKSQEVGLKILENFMRLYSKEGNQHVCE